MAILGFCVQFLPILKIFSHLVDILIIFLPRLCSWFADFDVQAHVKVDINILVLIMYDIPMDRQSGWSPSLEHCSKLAWMAWHDYWGLRPGDIHKLNYTSKGEGGVPQMSLILNSSFSKLVNWGGRGSKILKILST